MPNIAIIRTAEPDIPPLSGLVDGWPEEQHAVKVTVGGAPIEDGTRISDHAVVASEEVTLTGWVSDWNGGDRPGAAWDAVRRMAGALEPIRVVTEWGVYPSMLVLEADAPKRYRGMRFRLKLGWLNIVGVTDSELPEGEVSGPAADRTGEVSRGRVAIPIPDAA